MERLQMPLKAHKVSLCSGYADIDIDEDRRGKENFEHYLHTNQMYACRHLM